MPLQASDANPACDAPHDDALLRGVSVRIRELDLIDDNDRPRPLDQPPEVDDEPDLLLKCRL
jgi:hypothetical protein